MSLERSRGTVGSGQDVAETEPYREGPYQTWGLDAVT